MQMIRSYLVLGILLTACASEAFSDFTLSRPSTDVMRVSCWAGDMTVGARDVSREGRTETWSWVDLPEATPDYSRYGAPALPFLSCRVLLPPSVIVERVVVSAASTFSRVILTKPLMFVNQPYSGFDMTDPDQARLWAESNHEDPAIYSQDAFYPDHPVSFKVRNFRGYNILDISFTPLRYNPVTGILEFRRHTVLDIRLVAGDTYTIPVRGTENDETMVKRMVMNPEETTSYARPLIGEALTGKLRALRGELPLAGTTNYYVIITSVAFTNNFEPLRSHHAFDAGHQAAVVAVEDIYAQDPDTNKTARVKIRDYILNVLYSNGTEYVLIGGDTELVPSYAGLSDFYYGGGHIPVGRFSVATAQDISNCIAKALITVSNGTDKVQLIPREDEVGPTLNVYSNLFLPYMAVDVNGDLYNAQPNDLFAAMDTHTILWGKGHGYYLYPQWGPAWYAPNNSHIRPLGVNFGCSGAVFEDNEHPAELYQRAQNGNSAYIGTVQDVYYSSFDATFFQSYFENGSVGPCVGDMMLVAYPVCNDYTLLGDPRQEIVSPQFKALPRIRTPGAYSYGRSYNTDDGSGVIDDVVFRVVSFNNCGWTITNVACEPAVSNHFAFSYLQSNRTEDVRVQFLDVTNIPPGSYTIAFDVRDTTGGYLIQKKTVGLGVTDKNILSDADFTYDGSRRILPSGDYILAADLVVATDTSLVLQPGVVLHTDGDFGADWKVQVLQGGTIQALGTATNPIMFCDSTGDNAISVEIYRTELMPFSGDFAYCFFNGQVIGSNEPEVNFVNCTFLLGATSVTVFPTRVVGYMRNSLISANNMGNHGPAGDLSGLTISYSCLAPGVTNGFAIPYVPDYHVQGREILWGNDFLANLRPGLLSVCINAGDPSDPPDPDGTRADIGAFYHDLSGAIRVPTQYATIQAAVNVAATANVAVIVSSGQYNEAVQLPSVFTGIRIMGESETNRPILQMTNHAGNLLAFTGSGFLENFVLSHAAIGTTGRAVYASSSDAIRVGFRNCQFTDNRNNKDVFYVGYTNGAGGICLYMSDVDFVGNSSNDTVLRVVDGLRNSTMEPWSWLNACRFASNVAARAVMEYAANDHYLFTRELTWTDNDATNIILNSADGLSTNTVLDIRNALFCHNKGAFRTENQGNTLFENGTFVSNISAVVAAGNSRLELHNSIFWNNTATMSKAPSCVLAVNYTDINSTWPGIGTGNLSTNPLFVSAVTRDYHLQNSSPCLDTGDPGSAYANEPYPSGNRVDMGRYGNTPEAADRSVAPPIGVAASDGAYQAKVVVSWDSVADAGGYEVWRNTANNTNTAARVGVASGLTYEDASVAADILYYYWIKATNAVCLSEFGAVDTGYSDGTSPSVTVNQAAGQADPTNAGPIRFTVAFSEPVSDFTDGDVTIGGTAGATTAAVTGSGTNYQAAVSGMTGNGTVIVTVGVGVAHDGAGNGNQASISTDNTVTYDTMVPAAITTQPVSLTNNPGTAASFTVGASGTAPLYYQWQKNTVNIGSATNATYTIGSVASGDAGNYRCLVSNVVNAVTSAVATLMVNKGNQTITFPNPGQQAVTNTVHLSATASSGLAVTNFALVSGPGVLSGTNLTFANSGVVRVRASQAGDPNWNAAPDVMNTFNVGKNLASVFLGNLTQTYDGTVRSVTATTVPAGLSVVVMYDGNATAPVNAGSYDVIGTISDGNYQGVANSTLIVAKANQTITFPAIPDQWVTSQVTLSATAASGLPVTFTIGSGPGVITGGTLLSFTGVGTVSIIASQAGNTNWNSAANVTKTVTVKDISTLLPPQNLVASDGIYSNKVAVTWDAASGATSYEVWRSAGTNIASVSNLGTTATTTYDDLTAATTPGTILYYWVKAVNAADASGFSAGDSGYVKPAIGPTIKANGTAGATTINYPDAMSITIEMNADIYEGAEVDWWVVAFAGSSWYYLNNSDQWTEFDGNLLNCHPVYQGGLFNLPATEVLKITGLQVGLYTFWFAVDYPMDGILDLNGQILFDKVTVVVQ
ncbi:MAG: immunoglobulin domain-containing protein [Verrucomicrobia bacterium]|nr:immunoglobulin domain-containing protein [Verrucomicrobiota bacterium]MBU4428752.1 immunoglobulin domain-containing protein [Verrucomicrobiota bacterium]MCG2681622.1 MBG domain-containing protein [Kiritimatiellia bacterium]